MKWQRGLPAGRQGSMLVLALWALTLLGLFSVSLGFGVRQKAAMLSRLSTLDAVYPIAYSGVEMAKSLVRSDTNFDIDIASDAWAKNLPETPMTGGSFSLGTGSGPAVMDEERKINLNHTSVEIASRLFQRVSGLDRERADELVYCLLDWMDSDSFFGHPDYGAEDSFYENLPQPYSAKDLPYESIDELMLVKGMTRETFERIRPYVTVHGSGQVNVNTAGRDVLSALGFSTEGVETLLAYRAGPDGREGNDDDRFFGNVDSIATNVEQLAKTPLGAPDVVMIAGLAASGRLGVNSSAFSVTSRGVIEKNGAAVQVDSVFNRQSQVLYQRAGEVTWPART